MSPQPRGTMFCPVLPIPADLTPLPAGVRPLRQIISTHGSA
jgi:hypothetical protein